MNHEYSISEVFLFEEAEPTFVERIRRLELGVLARAILDATWEDQFEGQRPLRGRKNQKRKEATAEKVKARAWLLTTDKSVRENIEIICENAGIDPAVFWSIVDRYLTKGEDPTQMREWLKRIFV